MFNSLKNKIFNLKVSHEGGEMLSSSLRKKFKNKYNVSVDLYSYGGCFDPLFNISGYVKIGRYCSIAKKVRYFGANHPLDYLSTSPYFYNCKFGFNVKDVKRETLVIGNDVWIGYGVIITASCKEIGNGAVIAAGSVVTKSVPPYSIVAGNPAKIIRYRFAPDTIMKLEKSNWFMHTPHEIYENYEHISDIEVILDDLS